MSKSYLCDGNANCYDGSDEFVSNCPCSSDQFACENGLKCVPKAYICNGNDVNPQLCTSNPKKHFIAVHAGISIYRNAIKGFFGLLDIL